VGVDNVRDALTRERLFTEAALNIHQNFLVRRVRLVENVLERKIRWAEAVAEMLRKDPATVCGLVRKECTTGGEDKRTSIGGVLHGMRTLVCRGEKGVIRKAVKKRDFLHDLEN